MSSRREFLYAGAAAAVAAGGIALGYMKSNAGPRQDLPKPYVNVTLEGPDDGGDFGPNTPGTKTSGIQEALNYAHENFRDVYIWGGGGGLNKGNLYNQNVYNLDETLNIPWNQDFRLDGGNYVLNYTPSTGDAVVVDSCMSCTYRFGLIGTSSDGAALAIRPQSVGPDSMVVATTSYFESPAFVSSNPNGTGLMLDSSQGAIVMNKIFTHEINYMNNGLYLNDDSGTGSDISYNDIEIVMGNGAASNGPSTGIRVGDPGSGNISMNRIADSIFAPVGEYFDQTLKEWEPDPNIPLSNQAIGVDIFSSNNSFTLAFDGARTPGNDVVFEESSFNNILYLLSPLPNGYTNKSLGPNNRIVLASAPGFLLSTPPFPASGTPMMNDTPYKVQVTISNPGDVSQWAIYDVDGRQNTVPAGLFAGQQIQIDPGDSLEFTYSTAPAWFWKGIS